MNRLMNESFRGLNNAGALMRFKTINGFSKTEKVNPSGYITMRKIKRVLEENFTDELFREYSKKHGYGKRSRVGNDKKDRINKFINKLDKWPDYVIQSVYEIYQKEGFRAMLEELSKSKFVLSKTMRAEA